MKTNFAKAVRSQKSEVRSQTSGGRNLVGTCAPQNGSGLQPSTFNLQPSRRGFALIITLILLSVTLVMAVAFLAISRRERGSVTTATDTTTARLAADTALANAEAQIMSTVLANTNPFINNLIVSTNYINANGFLSGVGSPTNVNYFYPDGTPLTLQDFLINLTNLYFLPRAPVFVVTNQQNLAGEFRYYLDLNRNGKSEDSGEVTNVDNASNIIKDTQGNPVVNFQVGDPQWIGVLERPDAPHGPNNKFVSRYAFIALPAGNGLDLNYIHNQALHGNSQSAVNPTQPGVGDVFFRNQGVGSWEINLAAFLSDLNPNEWDPPTVENTINNSPYQYIPPPAIGGNNGYAFDDARALLAYRYNNNFGALSYLSTFMPNYPAYPVTGGPIDIIPFGPTMSTTALPYYTYGLNKMWSGADSTNHFFNLPSDLFDPNKTGLGVAPVQIGNNNYFTGRLLDAGMNDFGGKTNSTFDRYTYYRLLSQLGTDSKPESGKMNLNYDNLNPGLNPVTHARTGPVALTNFMAWTPLAFFTNAADRMLRMYSTNWFTTNPSNYLATYYGIYTNYFYSNSVTQTIVVNDPSGMGLTNLPLFGMTNQIPAFGLTNIPVYVNGRYVYSSSIQRVLQLAANIYDASTNSFFPSVFRPLFAVDAVSNVFIGSFTNLYAPANGFGTVIGLNDLQLSIPFDAETIAGLNTSHLPRYYPSPLDNIYGVPWIIGAKKGFPNFNQFAMESAFEITRKLRLTRLGTDLTAYPPSTFKIDQMFNCSVSNLLQVECWNSYFSNYTRPTTIQVVDHIQMVLTNDQAVAPAQPLWFPLDATLVTTMATNNWTGIGQNFNAGSFLLTSPTNLTAIALPTSTYLFNNTFDGYHFHPVGTNTEPTFEVNPSGLPQPHWWLLATNNLQVVMIDKLSGHVIDYVQMRGPKIVRDLTTEILGMTNYASMWETDSVSSGVLQGKSVPRGLEAQLVASQRYSAKLWSGQDPTQVKQQIDGFLKFIGLSAVYNNTGPYGSTNLEIQVPYSPTATPAQISTWQANDPLVHYLASDLLDSAQGTGLQNKPLYPVITLTPNERYQPWGRSVQMASRTSPDISPWNLALKDPLVWNSDHWDFPTNKFPTVGWLGRVHRGTPWQTVYLKSSDILHQANGINTWINWTGNFNLNDATNTAPVEDRLLFNIFSTAINDNGSQGTLSVNVAANPSDSLAGLAAWSAVFSGVVNLSNNIPDVGSSGTLGMNIINAAGSALAKGKLPLPPSYNLTYNPMLINPAGVSGANSALGQLVAGINSTRTNTTLFPKHAFGTRFGVGDILAVPALTEQSPFLHRSNYVNSAWVDDPAQKEYGISDEMYEWLPQQTLSLLRDSGDPRYVIYCYGQTLKPAPNGVVTSGATSAFGMVTNYQVVAETATRAVVQFKSVVVTNSLNPLRLQTNYSATLEQFNPLPPD